MVITTVYAEQLKCIILGKFQNFSCILARKIPSKLSQNIPKWERAIQLFFFPCENEVRNICVHSSGWIQWFLTSGPRWIFETCMSERLLGTDQLQDLGNQATFYLGVLGKHHLEKLQATVDRDWLPPSLRSQTARFLWVQILLKAQSQGPPTWSLKTAAVALLPPTPVTLLVCHFP